jgi:hypothetical protein
LLAEKEAEVHDLKKEISKLEVLVAEQVAQAAALENQTEPARTAASPAPATQSSESLA